MNASVPRSKRNHQNGLTLIEILVVVAIISVIGMVGTPLYQNYKVRTKVGSSLVTMTPVQRLATEYFILNESWPSNNTEAGAKSPETYALNYLTRVAISDIPQPGSIVLTYDNTTLRMLGNKNTIIYYPTTDAYGYIIWHCDEGTLIDQYRPANCR